MNQKQIRTRVGELHDLAIDKFGIYVEDIEIRFDLKGTVAGQLCRKYGSWFYRFNLYIAENNSEAYDNTVIHEVAHYITRILSPYAKSHGPEWRGIMRSLGGIPNRTHSMKCEKARKIRRWEYSCGCRKHSLSTVRHNKVRRGQASYACNKCKKNNLIHWKGTCMKIHGYEVEDFKLVVDGKGELVKPQKGTCDVCLGSTPKLIKANLEGDWRSVRVCTDCMIREGMYLSLDDLQEEIYELCGGRGRG